MPFYDLKCKRCGIVFNVMATDKEKESKAIPCPGCGSFDLEPSNEKSDISLKSRAAEEEAESHKRCACSRGEKTDTK